MPSFIKSSFLGLLLFVYQPFLKSYTPSLQGELRFLVDALFKSIIFFHLGPSKATSLNLDNLFLAFLFMGFIYLIPCLFINKVIIFQPFYFVVFSMEDL